ncbi:proteasome subunit beta type-5 [Rhizophagus irregularis DAOM 181602=DAOM 197198]|nr:proteasome subunit beta type-5 [Rhizophagus irregularis DAOM 181602=DAOM 197198]
MVSSTADVYSGRENSEDIADYFYTYKGIELSMGTMVASWDKTEPNIFYIDSDGKHQLVLDLHLLMKDSASGGSINVYHVKQDGWEFIGNYDIGDLHWKYQDQLKPNLIGDIQPMFNIQS